MTFSSSRPVLRGHVGRRLKEVTGAALRDTKNGNTLGGGMECIALVLVNEAWDQDPFRVEMRGRK